jgi:hypothetical protein
MKLRALRLSPQAAQVLSHSACFVFYGRRWQARQWQTETRIGSFVTVLDCELDDPGGADAFIDQIGLVVARHVGRASICLARADDTNMPFIRIGN